MADKSFEELLAELEGIEETDQEPTPAPQENPNFKSLRDAYKRQEKELRSLREFRETTTAKERANALQAAGLTESQAKVYLKAYDEVTPEDVEDFKTTVLGITAPAPETAPETPQEPKGSSFAPSAPQGGQGPSIRRFTSAEWVALSKTDTALAQKVFQEGRVDLD